MKDGKTADRKLKASEKELDAFTSQYHKLDGEVENITRDIESICTLTDARCPTCYGEVTEDSKKSSMKFLEAHKKLLKLNLATAKSAFDSAKAEVSTNRKLLDQVKERLQEYAKWAKEKLHLQDTIKRITITVDEATMIIQDQESIFEENSTILVEYKKDVQTLQDELKLIKIDTERFDELNKSVALKDTKLTDANRLLTDVQISKGRLQIEIKQYEDALERIKKYRAQREVYVREKFYYTQLTKIFGREIPSLIIENTCFELSKEANKVLKSISNDSIEFVTQRQNQDGTFKEVFEIEITRPGVVEPILIDSLSTGQKFRVVFAIRIALSRLLVRRSSTTMDFLFYDECFASLDEEGIDDVIGVFRYLKDEFRHQLIITHRADLKERFGSNIITVTQKNGESKLAI